MNYFTSFFSWVLSFLPHSPLSAFIDSISSIPYLAELNWFVPVSEIITVTEIWLVAVGVYYIYSVVMRFINLI